MECLPAVLLVMRNDKSLLIYAGMAFQIFATLGVAFFIGYKLDKYLKLSFPIFLLLMPLIAIFGVLYKVLRDTNKKK